MKSSPIYASLVLALLLGAGCHHTNRLAEYDFSGGSLAVQTIIPSRPGVFTSDFFFYDRRRPLGLFVKLGTALIKEAEAERARVRMDSANQCIDVAAILHDRIHERSASYLNADPVDAIADADFLLDVRIRSYGIDAEAWDAGAYFKIEAEALLIDRRGGRLIWETEFEETEPISPLLFGPHSGLRNIITAAALSGLSVEEMTVALEQLAEFSADRITRRLQRDLYRMRR
ncbi:MAG: hypothetical protein R2834_09350 [Rhodothermales bacterium]